MKMKKALLTIIAIGAFSSNAMADFEGNFGTFVKHENYVLDEVSGLEWLYMNEQSHLAEQSNMTGDNSWRIATFEEFEELSLHYSGKWLTANAYGDYFSDGSDLYTTRMHSYATHAYHIDMSEFIGSTNTYKHSYYYYNEQFDMMLKRTSSKPSVVTIGEILDDNGESTYIGFGGQWSRLSNADGSFRSNIAELGVFRTGDTRSDVESTFSNLSQGPSLSFMVRNESVIENESKSVEPSDVSSGLLFGGSLSMLSLAFRRKSK